MKNLDDFFGKDQSQNVDTLVEVTKRFFAFVSTLAEIVDELGREYTELSSKVDRLLQTSGSSGTIAAPPSPAASGAPPSIPAASGASPPIPATSGAPPPIPAASGTPPAAPPGFPTPPAAPVNPLQAELSSAVQNRASPPAAPSGLPPLPGAPAPASPGFGQSQAPAPASPGFGQSQAQAPAPRPQPRASPMNLKAQMNSELKEAFARIKKGWSEDDQ